jgi:hypothetical protein
MQQEKRPSVVGATEGQESGGQTARMDYSTLTAAQAALRRFYRQAEHANHDGLLDAYLVQLGEELVAVGSEIRRAEVEALDAWRKSSGHEFITQTEAYARANERHQEQMREREAS